MAAGVVLAGLGVLALGAYVVVLRRRLADLSGRLGADMAARAGPDEGDPAIVIEVRNVSELAVRRTAAARPLATVAPGVLRSIVLRQTVRQMRAQLAAEGVDAEVVLRRLPPGPSEPDHDDPAP